MYIAPTSVSIPVIAFQFFSPFVTNHPVASIATLSSLTRIVVAPLPTASESRSKVLPIASRGPHGQAWNREFGCPRPGSCRSRCPESGGGASIFPTPRTQWMRGGAQRRHVGRCRVPILRGPPRFLRVHCGTPSRAGNRPPPPVTRKESLCPLCLLCALRVPLPLSTTRRDELPPPTAPAPPATGSSVPRSSRGPGGCARATRRWRLRRCSRWRCPPRRRSRCGPFPGSSVRRARP